MKASICWPSSTARAPDAEYPMSAVTRWPRRDTVGRWCGHTMVLLQFYKFQLHQQQFCLKSSFNAVNNTLTLLTHKQQMLTYCILTFTTLHTAPTWPNPTTCILHEIHWWPLEPFGECKWIQSSCEGNISLMAGVRSGTQRRNSELLGHDDMEQRQEVAFKTLWQKTGHDCKRTET